MLSSASITLPRPGEEGVHTQPANEFLLVEEGRGVHRTAHGETPFRAGQIHFFPRGQLHAHRKTSRVCRCLTVRFRDEAFAEDDPADREAHEELARLKLAAYRGSSRVGLMGAHLRRVRELFRQAVGSDPVSRRSFLKGVGLQALAIMARSRPGRDRARETDPRIVRVLAWLDRSASESVRVEDAARVACLGRSRFHELFRLATGSGFVEYLTRLRVGMAVLQIAGSDRTVLEIAYACGFGSASRFYEAFARYHPGRPGEVPGRRQRHAQTKARALCKESTRAD